MDIHNVKFEDKDYPILMLLVDEREKYDLISVDGEIFIPLYQVIDDLICIQPDAIIRDGKRVCPNCGADMSGGEE